MPQLVAQTRKTSEETGAGPTPFLFDRVSRARRAESVDRRARNWNPDLYWEVRTPFRPEFLAR